MNDDQKHNLVKSFVVLTSLITLSLPIYKWGDRLNWEFSDITLYQLFPLFGLLAFSMMWLHFAVGAIKRRWPKAINYKKYFRVTGNIVLVLILLHPLILLAASGEILGSFDYVPDNYHLYLYFALFGLSGFLIYEVADRLRETKTVVKFWPLIKAINLSAFVAIYFHGLFLGQHLQEGGLMYLWIFYGITTAIFIIDGYMFDFRGDKKTTNLGE